MWRGAGDELLEEQRAVAERGFGLAAAAREGLGHVLGARHKAHAPPAAAGRGLEHHRVADAAGRRDRASAAEASAGRCRARRECPATCANARARDLVAEKLRALAGDGPTKVRPSAAQRSAKARVLRQEAVAGVHAVAAARLGRGDERVDVEVGRAPGRRRRRSSRAVPVVEPGVQRADVGRGVNTPTESMPSDEAARAMRMAISPRLAIRTRLNIAGLTGAGGRRAGPCRWTRQAVLARMKVPISMQPSRPSDRTGANSGKTCTMFGQTDSRTSTPAA